MARSRREDSFAVVITMIDPEVVLESFSIEKIKNLGGDTNMMLRIMRARSRAIAWILTTPKGTQESFAIAEHGLCVLRCVN